jgi:uncharacterized protein YnzC (UPF0291/DUF896 family)
MNIHSVTLDLPEQVYQQIQKAAEKSHRPLNAVLVEAVAAVAPVVDIASADLQAALANMAYWNDAALWRAAQTTMASDQRARLEELHHKQQREGLTQQEQEEEKALQKLYRETLLVRAQAAVLLKLRNYDVADPAQFHSLN